MTTRRISPAFGPPVLSTGSVKSRDVVYDVVV